MDALTDQGLCASLQIDAKQLMQWLREGLPCVGRGKRRRFDAAAVRDWLLANGKAEPAPNDVTSPAPRDQPVANTIGQVAQYFGVTERAVRYWINEGMPGKAGRPGTKEGQFPLFDIEDWRAGRRMRHVSTDEDTKHQAQARLLGIRAELLAHDLQQSLENLVDVDQVTRLWLRFMQEAKSQLLYLPAAIAKALPNELGPKVRKQARGVAPSGRSRS